MFIIFPLISSDFGGFFNGVVNWQEDWIDEWGGWWLYRWGDAAIRAVQLWLMLEAKECYEFSSLPYVPGPSDRGARASREVFNGFLHGFQV